jgi:sulfur-oxidizing protein SoxY
MNIQRLPADTVTRRRFVLLAASSAGAFAAASLLPAGSANATPDEMEKAIGEVVGDRKLQTGRVRLDLPPIVENGNTVPLSVSVESPMTQADHIKTVHIFNEKNPQPHVAVFHFSPRSGRAAAATRIRLADTQKVVAIAELSDGSLWSGSMEVIVTLAACVEG